MKRNLGGFLAAGALLLALGVAPAAVAQKSGGVLQMSHFDSPASMSMHEEATGAVNRPMMGVFNNLVMYPQDVAQNSMASIVPDLATESANRYRRGRAGLISSTRGSERPGSARLAGIRRI